MMKLIAQFTRGRTHTFWPRHRQRVSRATEMRCNLLHPLKGGIQRPGPTDIKMVFTTIGPKIRHMFQQPLGVFMDAILE